MTIYLHYLKNNQCEEAFEPLCSIDSLLHSPSFSHDLSRSLTSPSPKFEMPCI